MAPRQVHPAPDRALAARLLHPFGIFYTDTTSTTTPVWTDLPTTPTSATADWEEVYYSDYTKHYSEFYHFTTTPAALSPTVTATLTVTGANIQATVTATSNSGQNSDGDYGSTGLGSSAIAGIVVGSVVGLGLLGAFLVWFCLRSRKQPHKDGEVGHDELPQPHSGPQGPVQGPPAIAPEMVNAAAAAASLNANGTELHHGRRSPLPGPSSRLPSPFRHRNQMQMGSVEETVAFAKANNTTPARSTTDEDPPAYEETDGLGPGRTMAAGGSAHDISPELAAGCVSDGFRRYYEQPVAHDAESKPYDVLGPTSR